MFWIGDVEGLGVGYDDKVVPCARIRRSGRKSYLWRRLRLRLMSQRHRDKDSHASMRCSISSSQSAATIQK